MSLSPVQNLQQVAQDASGTSFTWDAVALADAYRVIVDSKQLTVVPTPAVKVLIAAGNHIIGVVPVANPTPATTLPFTVPPPPPPAPTGLTAVAASSTRVNLGWNAVLGASLYDVYRNGVLAFSTPNLTLSDGTVNPTTTYAYQVDAQVNGVTSALSTPPVVVITPVTPPQVPPTPTGLVAALAGTVQNPAVALQWDASPGATSYDLYRNGVLIKPGIT